MKKCLQCGKKISNKDFQPFCSERCKMIDLGKWLDGEYKIPESEQNLTLEEQILVEKIKNQETTH
jgi:hypothetical protein